MRTVKDLILMTIVLALFFVFFYVEEYKYLILSFCASLILLFFKYVRGYFYYKNLVRSQRESFIKVLKHDLKVATLAQIRGLEVLMKTEKFNDAELALGIEESCKYTFDMISALINTYRIDTGDIKLALENSRANDLFDLSLKKVSSLMKRKNIRLKSFLGLEDTVPVDKSAFVNVLTYLMTFALEHSPNDSTLLLFVRKYDGYFEFNIGFMGNRLSSKECETLFREKQSFSTVGQNIKMQLCKKIIESHGGNISLLRKEENVNFFSFTIPMLSKPNLFKVPVNTVI